MKMYYLNFPAESWHKMHSNVQQKKCKNEAICILEKCTTTPTTRFLPFRTVRRPKQHDFRVNRTVRQPKQHDFHPFVRYDNPNNTILGLIARYANPNNTIFTLLYGITTQTNRFLIFCIVEIVIVAKF